MCVIEREGGKERERARERDIERGRETEGERERERAVKTAPRYLPAPAWFSTCHIVLVKYGRDYKSVLSTSCMYINSRFAISTVCRLILCL